MNFQVVILAGGFSSDLVPLVSKEVPKAQLTVRCYLTFSISSSRRCRFESWCVDRLHEHECFIKDIAKAQPLKHLTQFFSIFKARGKSIVSPGAKQGLLPLMVPLVRINEAMIRDEYVLQLLYYCGQQLTLVQRLFSIVISSSFYRSCSPRKALVFEDVHFGVLVAKTAKNECDNVVSIVLGM